MLTLLCKVQCKRRGWGAGLARDALSSNHRWRCRFHAICLEKYSMHNLLELILQYTAPLPANAACRFLPIVQVVCSPCCRCLKAAAVHAPMPHQSNISKETLRCLYVILRSLAQATCRLVPAGQAVCSPVTVFEPCCRAYSNHNVSPPQHPNCAYQSSIFHAFLHTAACRCCPQAPLYWPSCALP